MYNKNRQQELVTLQVLQLYETYDIMFDELYYALYYFKSVYAGGSMKLLNLLMWVSQFGISIIFPTLLFLWLGAWLQNKFSLGIWVLILFGILGVLTSVSTVRSCLRSMLKAAAELSSQDEPPVSFNDHN